MKLERVGTRGHRSGIGREGSGRDAGVGCERGDGKCGNEWDGGSVEVFGVETWG